MGNLKYALLRTLSLAGQVAGIGAALSLLVQADLGGQSVLTQVVVFGFFGGLVVLYGEVKVSYYRFTQELQTAVDQLQSLDSELQSLANTVKGLNRLSGQAEQLEADTDDARLHESSSETRRDELVISIKNQLEDLDSRSDGTTEKDREEVISEIRTKLQELETDEDDDTE